MPNFKLVQRLGVWLLTAICLVGCGGGDSSPAFPRAIGYKSLIGVVNGPVYGDSTPTLSQEYAYCQYGSKTCLFAFTALKTKEAFQAYIAQSPGDASRKPQVLALGNAVDFSREQIWAFKYGVIMAATNLRLGITETATQIEIQGKVCSPIGIDVPVRLLDVFAIVPNDVPAKPVVIIEDTLLPNPCYV